MRLHVAIAADHGGFELKQELIRRLAGSLDIVDKGADEFDATDDYPDYVELVGRAVAEGEADRGIIICGSGVGACVAANKMPGIRACVCHETYSAHQGVEHDDLNVLCLGARVIGIEVATELAVAFLMARFSGEERHKRRLEKVAALENERLSRHEEAADDLEPASESGPEEADDDE
jgi:ribose 5-phosphate isomerase B